MTVNAQPVLPIIVPETAPFSEEQRAWLNGFFAGLVSLDQATALSAARAKDLLPATPAGPLDDGDDGATPWHDQTMAMAERMKLAEGRPLRRRLMAAMAQQDCGQCGYNCEDYSNVLFLKKEERFNLCVPGGKETARMLKKLWDETDPAAPDARPALVPDTVAAPPAEAGRSRDNPVAREGFRALPAQQGNLGKIHAARRVRYFRHRTELPGRRLLRNFSAERSRTRRPCHRGDRRKSDYAHWQPAAARGSAAGRIARAGARCSFPVDFVPGRRRPTEESEGAYSGGRSRRRRCDAGRACGDREISGMPARPRSICRGARAIAASSVFDFVESEGCSGQDFGDRRPRSVRRPTGANDWALPQDS